MVLEKMKIDSGNIKKYNKATLFNETNALFANSATYAKLIDCIPMYFAHTNRNCYT